MSLNLWDPETTGEELGGTSPGTLANWRTAGTGPPFVKIGGRVFYEPEAVREWVASRRRTSTTEPVEATA